jgi:hypothetical protein
MVQSSSSSSDSVKWSKETTSEASTARQTKEENLSSGQLANDAVNGIVVWSLELSVMSVMIVVYKVIYINTNIYYRSMATVIWSA